MRLWRRRRVRLISGPMTDMEIVNQMHLEAALQAAFTVTGVFKHESSDQVFRNRGRVIVRMAVER